MFETPHYVSELYMKKEDLRILRENVLLVVRDYNRFVLMTDSMANIGFVLNALQHYSNWLTLPYITLLYITALPLA